MTVAELLQQSMAQHERFKQAARSLQREEARGAVIKARDLRRQAIALDPDRTDPAWADEEKATPPHLNTHDELTRFYDEYLGAS